MIGPDLYSFRALWRHYRTCRRNKRNTANALAFEVNAETNLLALQAELRAHSYKPGPSICFVTDGPKPREVFAADFRDRVVHHLLVSHQERVFVDPPESGRYPVPPQKSLFGKRNQRGLPIGNLTSQFWGNVYLNELDQFVKRSLRCRYYVRYVDDLIFLSEDREELLRWRDDVGRFLRQRLNLELRSEPNEPVVISRGIDFVGWKTWWNHRLPRQRTLGNLRRRLEKFERVAVRPRWAGLARQIELPRHDRGTVFRASTPGRAPSLSGLHASLASYAGHLRHGAAARAWERVWQQYPWLALLFDRDGWCVGRRWPARPVAAQRFQRQYSQLIRGARQDCLVFTRVGRFIEFYGPQRVIAERSLGLRLIRSPRGAYAFKAGFPGRLAGAYRSRAIRSGLSIVDVAELDSPGHGRCKPRQPVSVLVAIQ